MRLLVPVLLFGLLASIGVANDWGKLATISTTMGVSDSRLCVGEASRGDIGCPAYAPSLTTAGDVSITGNVSANKFLGDGSGLTGISTQGDRITSGTLSMVAISHTSYVSLTTGAVNWGYFGSGLSYLPFLQAANVSSTNISTSLVHHTPVSVAVVAGRGGNYVVSGTTSVSASSAGTIGFGTDDALRMFIDSTGKVGIGTAIPNALLDVYGTISASALYVNGQAVTASGSPDWYDLTRVPTVLQNISNSTGSVSVTTLYASGNIGIGTTSPGATLDVSGTIGAALISATAATGTVSATNVYAKNISATGTVVATAISATTNQTSVTTLYASGRVGIGTASPLANLDVRGTVQFSTTSSTVMSITANAWNTITHNLNISCSSAQQNIFAINGDYDANTFTIPSTFGSGHMPTANSFQFRASGGVTGGARINWFIVCG